MNLKQKILLRSRIILLEKTITDIIDGAYLKNKGNFITHYESIIETIRKGIEKQYLKEIVILGLKDTNIVHRLIFKIDWETHKLLCSSGNNEYSFSDNAVAKQISQALPILSSFISDSINRKKLNKFDAYYVYRDNININEAREYLGLSAMSNKERNELVKFEEQGLSVSFTPYKLKELHIKFEIKK